MTKTDCPCKKKKCPRHGNCDACKAYHAEKKHLPACERKLKKANNHVIVEAFLLIFVLQVTLSALKAVLKLWLPDNRFAEQMLTMCLMLPLTAAVILYARKNNSPFPLFPKPFGKWYKVATAATGIILISSPDNYRYGLQGVLVLIYGSIVTPIYEELLFRGYIWNRLEQAGMKKVGIQIWNTVLFAVWHLGYMIPNILCGNWEVVFWKIVAGACYGAVLGFVRTKTKNCYSTMLLHGVLNLLMV